MTVENVHTEQIRVNPFECDFNRRWKPAAFFQHLTETAHHHANELGVGFDALNSRGLSWVHARMKIVFYGYPGYDDAVTIRTWPRTIQQRLFFMRDFEVLDAAGARLAAATSAWLVFDTATRRLVAPNTVEFNFALDDSHLAVDPTLERIVLPEILEERLRVRAGYSVLDILGHVNNSRYIEWLCDALPLELYSRQTLDWMQVNYDHEVLPGQEVAVMASPGADDPDLWAAAGRNCTTEARAFSALLHWRTP
ncbi:MAG: acyl-[acyl-carrier-protein] thioesterase [Anaerolineae bacterium]